MSRNPRRSGSYVDTGYLRDHVYKLREDKKRASRLYDYVLAMKRNCDPTVSYQYDSILRNIQQIIDYFDRMANSLARISDEATYISNRMGGLIEDDTENLRHKTKDTFML